MALMGVITADTSTQSYTEDNGRYGSSYTTPATTAASYGQPTYSDTYSAYYGQYKPSNSYTPQYAGYDKGYNYKSSYKPVTKGVYGYGGFEAYGGYQPVPVKKPFLVKKVPVVKVNNNPCKSAILKAFDWLKPCKKKFKFCGYEPHYDSCLNGNSFYNYNAYGWTPTMGPYGGPIYNDLASFAGPYFDPLISNQYPLLRPQFPLLG